MQEIEKRTHNCGELRGKDAGKQVSLMGWIFRRREHKNIIFLDLYDREGVTQITLDTQLNPQFSEIMEHLKVGACIAVEGRVVLRTERGGSTNKDLPTGEIEVLADKTEILSTTEPLPFPFMPKSEDQDALELTRLQYRYLELRRRPLQRNLRLRSDVSFHVRSFLHEHGFIEVETPILMKSTPEGARDYLVPSRQEAGHFFALPQSPQLYKQLLMIGGFERYYQIARCFRDEDLRADRQPEFTQIDMEMSFVKEKDIQEIVEGMFASVFKKTLGVDLPRPFQSMDYHDVMEKYGEDKPDLRYGLELTTVSHLFENSGFNAFKGAHVKGLVVPNAAGQSKSWLKKLEKVVKERGAKALAIFKMLGDKLDSPLTKFFSEEEIEGLKKAFELKDGDLLLMIADSSLDIVNRGLSTLRRHLAEKLDLIDEDKWAFLWINRFPLVGYDEETGQYFMMNHPFTMPLPEDIDKLESDPLSVRSCSYDLVLNGFELGSGSLRVHKQDLQRRLFNLIGVDEEEAKERFGFFLEALSYGPPPHGGIGLGFDRIIMLMAKAKSLRDVIAFPKTQKASCPMTNAPGEVSEEQLKEVHIQEMK